jgi:hypothetical protein
MEINFLSKLAKEMSDPDSNEDFYAVCLPNKVALSDGASESFDSKNWANILANHFVECKKHDKKWLARSIAKFSSLHDLTHMSWSKQAAFERGSFATLLGVTEFQQAKHVEVFCVGDSLAVFLEGDSFIDSFPYSHSIEFDQKPELFSTLLKHNSFFSHSFGAKHRKKWNFEGFKEPNILCMTDALGQWALRMAETGKPRWDFLRSINNEDSFKDFILLERASKSMRIDDTTLIAISF